MLHNCNYNKIRLVHDLSRIVWHLKHHAKKDAKGAHSTCAKMYTALENDLEKHIGNQTASIGKLAKGGNLK
jgi:hypothetical protein